MYRTKKLKSRFSFFNILGNIDITLLLLIIGLCLFGLLAVYNSSVVMSLRDFGNEFRFLKDQSISLAIGLGSLLFMSMFDYHRLYKFSIPLLFITLILLIAVFIPGLGIKALGARRWINLNFLTLQPTEVAKLVLILYLSAWFTSYERNRLLPFMILLAIVVGLIVLQPDLGTAVIITILAGILYFVSGASWTHFLFLVPLGVTAVIGLSIISPYRFERIKTFINPETDPLGKSYHIRQVLIALGSGKLFGVGFGKSRQKYEYLPEANTDSIFAIISEEVGFIGSSILILIYMIIIWRSFQIAQHAPDRFGRLLACGICSWFAIQTIINLGAMVALLPLTGVPLPLISYGGSSLIMMLTGFGIMLNISKQKITNIKRKS